MREQMLALLAGDMPKAAGLDRRIVRLDGAVRYVEEAAAPFEDENGLAAEDTLPWS